MTKFINAIYYPDILTVEYIADNGDHLLRSGGTIAWRFNNPGNLRPGSKYTLQIGKGKTKSGEFLIFPTVEAGRAEKKGLLLRKYKGDTIIQMMKQYAPPSENDTAKYTDYITTKSGLSKDSIIGDLTEAQLDSLMNSMEQYEGFNAMIDTRKEKWIKTTIITLSDGARPIAEHEVIIKQDGNEVKHKTDHYGQLPAIPHLKKNDEVELWVINAKQKLEKIDSFILGNVSQSFNYFTDFFSANAATQPHVALVKQDKKKPEPYSYVIQPGDTLGKIAKKFKTSADKIQKENQLRDPNKILPGQRLSINGSSSAPTGMPTVAKVHSNKSTKIAAIPTRSKEAQGQPLAVMPSDQKRAPWMEVAIKEAIKWAGKKETIITKTDNFHEEIGLGGDLGNTPWCASFVNYCLMESGNPYERSASSQFATHSKKFTKINSPIYGSIIVWQKSGKGHVAFVYGKDSISLKTIALGGNQNDKITFMLETDTTKTLVGYFVPNTYLEFSKKENVLSEFDVVNLNRSIGNTAYSRKKQIIKDR
ncbi:TIGR02594 family protein [Sulfuriferula thiophila]|uniref:TIGR02594 family protein n=1 Tax=Sulfuriferula thiophila TaxID=1781211 RepID=UPI000F610EFB|nr:TIGR02594 family protein [Sulfuriferula thiophila]